MVRCEPQCKTSGHCDLGNASSICTTRRIHLALAWTCSAAISDICHRHQSCNSCIYFVAIRIDGCGISSVARTDDCEKLVDASAHDSVCGNHWSFARSCSRHNHASRGWSVYRLVGTAWLCSKYCRTHESDIPCAISAGRCTLDCIFSWIASTNARNFFSSHNCVHCGIVGNIFQLAAISRTICLALACNDFCVAARFGRSISQSWMEDFVRRRNLGGACIDHIQGACRRCNRSKRIASC